MEEKLFNPVLTATPGKPAGKQQSTFKSTQGKATCLGFFLFSAVVKITFTLNLILNQMYNNPVAGPKWYCITAGNASL